jgi:hypothetical protein
MGIATSHPVDHRTRSALHPVRDREGRREPIHIVANPLGGENPALARALEADLRRLLSGEDVGPVEVRFRICRDENDGLRFICKVENPPFDGEAARDQWRWWSPLMTTADDFRTALQEGLRNRRERRSGETR